MTTRTLTVHIEVRKLSAQTKIYFWFNLKLYLNLIWINISKFVFLLTQSSISVISSKTFSSKEINAPEALNILRIKTHKTGTSSYHNHLNMLAFLNQKGKDFIFFILYTNCIRS